MRKFFKYFTVVVIILLGLISILFTLPFRKNVEIDWGTIIVGTIFLVYAIFTLYGGSVLMLISSFWSFPRRVLWFMGIAGMAFFILILNNLIIFADRGGSALFLFIPLVIYLISSFRFFRRLAKGRK